MNQDGGPKRNLFDGSVAQPLKLLLLEASEDDASEVIRELGNAGYEPRWRSVSTEADYREALEPNLDLVLADYQIPGWSMPEALDLLRERGWDIPFIVVSGVAGEERAVAAMRQGASDYVLKDRLQRLGPAVRIALEQKRERSERREHESALAREASARSEARYRALFYDNPMPMWVFDQETHAFLAVNDAAIDHYGYSREQFLGMRVEDIRPVDELPRLARTLADKSPGIDHVGTWRHLTRDGREIRVEITTHAIEFAGRAAIVVLANDVTERVVQQNKLSRMNRIRAVTAGITSAIVRSTDRAQLLQEACQVACTEGVFEMAWAGLIDPETGDGRMVASCGIAPDYRDLFRFTSQPDRPDSERPLSRCARFGTPYVCNDIATAPEVARIRGQMLSRGHRSGAVFPLRTRDGVFGVFAMSAAEAGFFDHEEVALLEWLVTDLSYALDRMVKSERLDYLAYYDVLTGLPNSTLFRDRLGQLARSAFRDQRQVALIMLEVVHLKRINDILGRQAGDDALRKVADRLRVTLDDNDSLGRLGSTTFAVARTCDEAAAATCLLNRLHDAFEEPFEFDGKALRIGVRVGIATYPDDADGAEALLACAETALDHAKSSD